MSEKELKDDDTVIGKMEKRIKELEEDMKTLKTVYNLPTHYEGKRIIKKDAKGKYYILEDGRLTCNICRSNCCGTVASN